MLAFMPRPSPMPQFHPPLPPSLATDSMSLALLRSTPVSYNQQNLLNAIPSSPSPSKRPKLSLNTANVTQGSTSLRLETLSATSPTAINTFQNRDAAKSPSDATKNATRPILLSLNTDINNPSPSQISLPASTDTPIQTTSPLSFSPNAFFPTTAPYTLPINTTSILTNGPIPRRPSQDASSSSIAQEQQPAPTSPPQKKVSFRDQLTEDIQNTEFTLRHSDIEETICTLKSDDEKKTVIKSGSKRDSVELEPSDSCPATPVAGRAKRHKWVWTLETDRSSDSLTSPVGGEC